MTNVHRKYCYYSHYKHSLQNVCIKVPDKFYIMVQTKTKETDRVCVYYVLINLYFSSSSQITSFDFRFYSYIANKKLLITLSYVKRRAHTDDA